MSFWEELKRRNVVKVGMAYAIVAWLIAQVASVVAPALTLPEWTTRFVVLVLLLGFPLALFLAWAYEVTPEGIQRTKHVPLATSIRQLTGKRLNYVVTALLVLAVAYMALDDYLLPDRDADSADARTSTAADTQASPNASGQASVDDGAADASAASALPSSIAVLPFENLSPDESNAYFAAGIHEEILNQLAKLNGLNVIARTSVQRYLGTTLPISEIARELNVETVMEGSVRYADGRVLITAQLIDPRTNAHLWSDSYDHEFSDIFAIQTDVALNVAQALEVELSLDEQRRIARAPTESVAAYDHFLSARVYFLRQSPDSVRLGIEQVDRAIALDEDFALAWVLASELHNVAQSFFPTQAAEQQRLAIRAARRAIDLDPDLGNAHAALGYALSQQLDWIDAETSYRRAISLGIALGDMPAYSVLQLSAGNFARAREILVDARRIAPQNLTALAFLFYSNALLGDWQTASAQYALGKDLNEDWPTGDDLMMHLLLARGDRSRALAIPPPDPITAAVVADLDSPEAALRQLRRIYADPTSSDPASRRIIGTWAAYFGDHGLALDALRSAILGSSLNAMVLWLPHLEGLRSEAGFETFAREIGLVDYWREFGWPSVCRPRDGDDFECD